MPMTPYEIKEALAERKITLAAIGRRLRPKVSRVSVARVANQVPGSKSARIQSAIANAIGRDVKEVFDTAA